jgi:hypothetical protein
MSLVRRPSGALLALTLPFLAAATPSGGVVESTPPAETPPTVQERQVGPPTAEDVIRGSLVTRTVAPAGPEDRGGTETIGGDPDAPRQLTAEQMAKLARARAAVELARAQGTLEMPLPEETPAPGPPLSLEAIDEMKRESMATQEPLPYDPASDAPRAPGVNR